MNWQHVYDFWFQTLTPEQWFSVDSDLDALIEKQFSHYLEAARAGELFSWRDSAKGALSEIIVLDQFSRNIYRNQALAFAQDAQALTLAQTAIKLGQDKELTTTEAGFLYLPFMHSENKLIHGIAETLFKDHPSYEYELAHKRIIDKFGRYPHRNQTLGRVSTPDELIFLTQENSSF